MPIRTLCGTLLVLATFAAASVIAQFHGSRVTLTQSVVTSRGSGPYLLDRPNTTYVLAGDITTPGTAFVVTAPNVTLDLGGRTLTYGDQPHPVVRNGGFEEGTSPTDIPGWDTSGAHGARRAPARTGMWGQWMLHIPDVSGAQRFASAPISLPAASREYVATITPKGRNIQSLLLEVLDSTTGTVLASRASRPADLERGFANVVPFTPTTANPVKLRVTITPGPAKEDKKASIDLDYAAVFPARDFGIVATSMWKGNLPAQLRNLPGRYQNVVNFRLRNGTVRQGRGRSFAGDPLFFPQLKGLTVDKVDILANGMDTRNLEAQNGQNVLVSQSTFRSGVDHISDRMRIFAAVDLRNLRGSATIDGNTFLGVPQVGVFATNNPAGSKLRITNNTIKHNALVTDGYGILLNGVRNFAIAGNIIAPASGRGILLDGFNGVFCQNGEIANNQVTVQERPNLEYGPKGLEVTALRLRNFKVGGGQHRISIHSNTFIARTGPGLVWAAVAARITQRNNRGQMTGANNLLDNNLFRAVVTSADPAYRAFAVSLSGIETGTGLELSHNVLESNDTSLNLGDNDSWQGTEADVLMVANTLSRAADAAKHPYASVRVGSFRNTVDHIRLIDTRYENGATANPVFEDPLPKEIETGRLLNVTVRDGAGRAIQDARVQLLDNQRQELFSGTTDTSGAIGVPIVTTIYRQSGEDPKHVTEEKRRGPLTLQVNSGTAQARQEVPLPPPANLVVTAGTGNP